MFIFDSKLDVEVMKKVVARKHETVTLLTNRV